ncbi:hypothetical protein GCM10009621_03510 [Corynebacterium felinum]
MCMSISRDFDAYVAERGIEISAEVVPENECQVFVPLPGQLGGDGGGGVEKRGSDLDRTVVFVDSLLRE